MNHSNHDKIELNVYGHVSTCISTGQHDNDYKDFSEQTHADHIKVSEV